MWSDVSLANPVLSLEELISVHFTGVGWMHYHPEKFHLLHETKFVSSNGSDQLKFSILLPTDPSFHRYDWSSRKPRHGCAY
ncbi:hypothetical protein TNCV_3562731 [Trichonephila clavipes]|nr:hypothetical protein TNCV_3562731 [Trichonephila clavipes]